MPIKSKFGQIPITEKPFGEQFLEKLWLKVVEDPNRACIINAHNYEDRITYEQLYIRIQSLSTWLHKNGFRKGDVALIASPNCWQFVATFAAVISRGGALSGASYLFTEYELQRQINDCRAKFVFCAESTVSRVLNTKNTPSVEKIVVIDESGKNFAPEVIRFSQILRTEPAALPKPKVDVKKDLVLIPYSSGTTGVPKGVMLTHYNVSAMIGAIDYYYNTHLWPKFGLTMSQESVVLIMPMYHVYGSTVSVNAICNGTQLIMMKAFDPDAFCKALQTFKIKTQMLVPPILVFLAKSPIVDKYDLSSLRFIQSGAAPLGAEICEEVFKRFPNLQNIAQGYGMTETTVASHFVAVGDKPNFATAGLLAPNMELKIEDPVTHKELKQGERGEVCVRGPNIMAGYLNRPDATRDTVDKHGFLHTGDIGYVDENGLVYIVDRLKELIKVRGFQVPPAELEDLLLSHPKIADSAVIGIKDKKAGELPKAYVVRRDPTLTEQEVKDFVAEKTIHYKHLKGGVEFIDLIPRSLAGKILRKELRDRAANGGTAKL